MAYQPASASRQQASDVLVNLRTERAKLDGARQGWKPQLATMSRVSQRMAVSVSVQTILARYWTGVAAGHLPRARRRSTGQPTFMATTAPTTVATADRPPAHVAAPKTTSHGRPRRNRAVAFLGSNAFRASTALRRSLGAPGCDIKLGPQWLFRKYCLTICFGIER